MKTYWAKFTPSEEPGEEGVIYVTFPGLDNLFTDGRGVEQALDMARDVLALVLAEAETLPKQPKREKLELALRPGERLYPVPLDPALLYRYAPKQKINASLPTALVIRIDEYRAATGQDRSEFLKHASEAYLEHH
ncbi:MAG: type II toxin-antitoxin system HicB family antitoxin [bacterium]|nr:type II toxin-antitoxin system HicB family antitoxin [bacterium]